MQVTQASKTDCAEPLLRIAVGIATSGRPQILAETLVELVGQSRPPARVLVLYGQDSDVEDLPLRFPQFLFLKSTGGLCEKRNRILDMLRDGPLEGSWPAAELLLFMDDDFLLDSDYLRVTEEAFRRDRRLVGATGRVSADGATGPGLTVEQGRVAMARARRSARRTDAPRPAFNTYGCNMTFRLEAVFAHGLRFDQKLPAYAWYEDIDFSRRLLPYGSLMLLPGALGVHLGAKVGRVSGAKLGYSQVANPVYLWRKGSFPLAHTLRSIARNFLANAVRSLKPEGYVDRRGRLRGNLVALADLLRGRVDPGRMAHMR